MVSHFKVIGKYFYFYPFRQFLFPTTPSFFRDFWLIEPFSLSYFLICLNKLISLKNHRKAWIDTSDLSLQAELSPAEINKKVAFTYYQLEQLLGSFITWKITGTRVNFHNPHMVLSKIYTFLVSIYNFNIFFIDGSQWFKTDF